MFWDVFNRESRNQYCIRRVCVYFHRNGSSFFYIYFFFFRLFEYSLDKKAKENMFRDPPNKYVIHVLKKKSTQLYCLDDTQPASFGPDQTLSELLTRLKASRYLGVAVALNA